MMELSDSTRSGLVIDLNEIPSPPVEPPAESIDVVRSYHDHPSPPSGGPAGVPSASGAAVCAACGRPEDSGGYVVVCDACERGFHVGCSGAIADEWLCAECVSAGEKSKRWPLGAKKRLLDMNASPPSDGDGAEEGLEMRKHSGVNFFGGHPTGASATYPNNWIGENGFGLQKSSGVVLHNAKLGFEEISQRAHSLGRSLEEVDLNFPGGKYRGGNNSALRKQSRNPSEMFLQALREFVRERNGVLEEGWRVEFRQSAGNELYAVYCAPNGKTFDSVFEVACHLGLASKHSDKESEMKVEGGFPVFDRAQLPRKRKTRRSTTNGYAEIKEGPAFGFNLDLPPNGAGVEFFAGTFDCNVRYSETSGGEGGCSESQNNNEGLPVQFEDFFLLSLGKVDSRPSYHNTNFIWPVGYKSCWHDKISGSIFISEVLDGGDGGPIFKVKRLPCSSFPVPTGSTVLLRQHSRSVTEEGDKMAWDDDGSIHMILSDPSPPMEIDVLSCLSFSNGGNDMETSNKLSRGGSSIHENSENVTSCEAGLPYDIGEFTVEENSSSLAWKVVTQKLVNACAEVVKQKGSFEYMCKHVRNETSYLNNSPKKELAKEIHSSLDKFSCPSVSLGIPSAIKADEELNSFRDALEKWLDQDRFGLDVDFVQEILEQLPRFQTCSRYQPLNERRSCSSSVTVGNGLLAFKMRGGSEGNGNDSNGLFRRSKKSKLIDNSARDVHCRPVGKKLCSRIPSELVGDVYQVWESLWRFHDSLGLKEPLSLEEIEDELINPWSDNLDLLQKFENEIRCSQTLNSSDSTGAQTLTSSLESGLTVSLDNSPAFIQMATRAMKEAAQNKLASITFNRCSGVALTKAHKSLLRVLIGELQSKVASLVDPNFDSGESKSKRGRKKDFDSSVSARRTKLNILPINELTWPELARRYMLAVLSMDGNLDSAEIIVRESGKVFRCLQGDGGVLCGSLTGVAGMEADALLLAEATKQIFGLADRENDVLTFEDEVLEAIGTSEKHAASESIPEWAQVLAPVRKLPTNVGTRIRKCVYEALKLNPPEWAKKILEHSISKEVYKGNASGPTKKAVLSVLADVTGEVLPPKPDNKRKKKKTVISVSDAIMKQCRIVLRRAAAADDSKFFCNLLGRKLTNSSENDDEGLLGSPAMVSRPLDFRTIDLRLAAGAYRGSLETFLEDVRELWSNVRNAFGDQPDMVELAETLAQNFETLYEKEVLPLVDKFADFVKLESLNAERKKEIDEALSSISVIPKAPWDDGVCKVCGIDRDDDSVLLCDTCDAEYHTYCLNPPLARIPEGNWYCPSCVVSKRIAVPDNVQVILQRPGKKYQGEVTRVYLEGLSHLAAKMEEKEYWDFTADERTFLLKFLCDELLNSAVIRQHLEQCAETSTELQQKLRSHFVEWKILKSREEILVARAAKLDPNPQNSLGAAGIRRESSLPNHGKGQTPSLTEKSNCCGASPDELSTIGGGREGATPNAFESTSDSQYSTQNPLETQQLKDGPTAVVDSEVIENPSTNMDTPKNDNPLTSSNSLPREIEASGAETCSTDTRSTSTTQQVVPSAVNELQAHHAELSSVKTEITALQETISSVESELLKVSVRREFLGSDSLGCLYWASGVPPGSSWITVDGSTASQGGKRTDIHHRGPLWRSLALESSLRSVADDHSLLDGSNFGHLFLPEQNNAAASLSVSYQTDEEVDELLKSLKISDPKERELKEAIRHWQKLRFHEVHKNKSQGQEELVGLSATLGDVKDEVANYLMTRATNLLEKRHGACVELEIIDTLKKKGKKARVSTVEDKMYRCECLELVWPSRHHCILCHKTFMTDAELEKHNEGKCNSASLTQEKGKETSESVKMKGNLKSGTGSEIRTGEIGRGDSFPELSAKLIKFQDEGLSCPYDLESIRSKFVTNDSCKDVIRDIGLIGSNGVVPFVPSVSPCINDSLTALISPQKKTGLQRDGSQAVDRPVPQGTGNASIGGFDALSCISPKRSTKEMNDILKPQKPRTSGSRSSVAGLTRCCVVPQSSLRPLVGKVSQILRQLKINLLDMDAALPEEALRPSKAHLGRRWAWRAFVKSATTIYEMVQATMILEDAIKTDSIKNEWWYWSSFSAAARTSTVTSLALRIYSLDAAIIYEKSSADMDVTDNLEILVSQSEQKQTPASDQAEKTRSRRSNKKRKELES